MEALMKHSIKVACKHKKKLKAEKQKEKMKMLIKTR